MKGWRPVLIALLLGARPGGAAEDIAGAARELARRTAQFNGGSPIAASWRNLSSLGPGAVDEARAAFESILPARNLPPEASITISENASSFLMVEEVRRGDDRQVWIASWKRSGPFRTAAPVQLEKRLLAELPEPILDVAAAGDGLLVLTPTALLRTSPRESVRIAAPPPRDPRGRIRLNGTAVQVYLPGWLCSGGLEPGLSLSCRQSDEPWTLDSGRVLLLANHAPGRNYFDGRVVTQTGLRKTAPPFYSAAAVDGSLWLLAGIDGRSEFFDGAMEPAGPGPALGSDVVAGPHCGGQALLLATRPGDGPDAAQAYSVSNRSAAPVGEPLEMPGRVTALWPGVAVAHSASGAFQAYSLTVACAP